MGNAHLWLTFIGGYGMSILLLIQGLDGAPRRWAVMPEQYDTLTQLTIPFVLMTAFGQVIFGYNLVQSLRGRTLQARDSTLRSLGLTAAMLGAAAVIGGTAVLAHDKNAGETPAQPGLSQAAAAGQQLYVEKCGACHTLSAAGSQGQVGPNLDEVKPTKEAVLAAIDKGGRIGGGAMPEDLYVGQQAEQVAAYVAEVAGK